jgi:hypothetical protein
MSAILGRLRTVRRFIYGRLMKAKNYTPIFCSCIKCKLEIKTCALDLHYHHKHEFLFPKKPKFFGYCKHCNSEIHGYDKKVFCNSSCAAKSNNLHRSSLTIEKQKQTLKKTWERKNKLNNACESKPKQKIKSIKVSQCKVCNKDFSGERKTCSDSCYKTLISIIANSKPKHFRPANRASIYYQGKKLGSKYELTLCKSLDNAEIRWEIPRGFKYIDPKGKSHTYYPDIYLPDYDIYLDPKNDYLINNVNPYHGFKDVDKSSG